MGYPGRDYRQGANTFLGRKKKRGEDFSRLKKGVNNASYFFFVCKKEGNEIFLLAKLKLKSFFWYRRGILTPMAVEG